MATLYVPADEDTPGAVKVGGTFVIPLKVEIHGVGTVRNPGDPGWVDHSNEGDAD